MKRVKADCIFQTFVFMQKADCDFSKESQFRYKRNEVKKNNPCYQIVSIEEQIDASIIVC